MLRKLKLACIVAILVLGGRSSIVAASPPVFPALGSAQSIRGELVDADFIHRSGHFRTADGELMDFAMPPYAMMTYQGTESDLRDVPLGAQLEFLLLPDAEGRLTQLVGTKHGQTQDAAQRRRFIEFTKARGIAGWVDQTADKTLTVTFFSGNPEVFAATWDDDFAIGKEVTVCVANDELRTWQPTSCGERGTVVDMRSVPVEGYGCSGRQVVIRVNNMLEGFRQGRIVRVFGSGWKVRNQLYQECLINYGYAQRAAPDFRECHAKQYPEQFPYRTDYGNRHLPWFQATAGSPPPMYSEHLMLGDLTAIDPVTQSGEFKTERTGETVRFTMLDTGTRSSTIRFLSGSTEGRAARLSELPLGRRYRFHMYQDMQGCFTRCSYISDDYSHLTLNSYYFQIRAHDPVRGRVEVSWQSVPVTNYQKDKETPPPYGHSVLRFVPETRVWKGKIAESPTTLKIGDSIKVNVASEFISRPSYCTDVWIVDKFDDRSTHKK